MSKVRILSRGMTADEQEKFYRLESGISKLFASSGHTMRLCVEGRDKGGSRLIRFLPDLTGPALASIPADQFLSASDDDVFRELKRLLAQGDQPE